MSNIKLLLEYDGACFSGWQRQPNATSVESELKQAIETYLGYEIDAIYASGRTDAGVHALGQVVNFHAKEEPDLKKLRHGLSSLLRNKVSVISAELVDDDFHARYDAIRKYYLYKIYNFQAPPVLERNLVWHVPQVLNLNYLKEQAECLLGEHDFKSFQASNCNAKTSVRTIYSIDIQMEGLYFFIEIIGGGFLKHMVRNIVGTLVALNLDNLNSPCTTMAEILAGKDRTLAGPTAPPHGLYLKQVIYG